LGRTRARVNRLADWRLPHRSAMLNRLGMADTPSTRIETALARIEAAAIARAYATERLARRHALLRERIEDAVASLDTLIARETAAEGD